MNTAKQDKKQDYNWLKAYQFVKGQSGNPKGKEKGKKSLKTFAREFLESLPDEEKIKYLKTLPTEIVWKMAEGMPDTKSDLDVKGVITVEVPEALAKKHAIKSSSSKDSE